MKRLAMILVVVGLVVPAASRADVRFAPALASSASDPGVASQYDVVGGNAAGVVAAAYTQKVGAVYYIHARVKPAGTAAFGPAANLSGAHAESPAVAVAADGTITVAWHQATPCAGSSVWIATAPPGGPFGTAAKVSDNAFYPHLAVAPDGTVTLLYEHDKGSCVGEERAQVRPRTRIAHRHGHLRPGIRIDLRRQHRHRRQRHRDRRLRAEPDGGALHPRPPHGAPARRRRLDGDEPWHDGKWRQRARGRPGRQRRHRRRTRHPRRLGGRGPLA